MKITKKQLQTIIREEYVKVIFEKQGKKITASQAKIIAENINEGFLDDILGAFKSSGKDAVDQQEKNESAIIKTEEQLKKELQVLQMKSKDMLDSNGFVGDENDVAVLSIDLFRAACEEVLTSSKVSGPVKFNGKLSPGSGKFRRTG